MTQQPPTTGRVFCTDSLWDSNLTWYTDDPDFTDCFQKTVLTYTPVGVLLLLTPIEIWCCLSNVGGFKIPRTKLNLSRTILVLCLIISSLVEIIYGIFTPKLDLSYIVGSIVNFAGYSLVLGLQIFGRIKGQVTSGPLFIFWLLEVIGGAINYRSWWKYRGIPEDPDYILPFSTFAVQYPNIVILFLLSCWADTPANYSKLDSKDNDSPQKYASFLSKMTFFWFDSFVYKAWKTSIKAEDLWTVMDEHLCKEILPKWEKALEKEKRVKARKNKNINIFYPLLSAFGSCFLISAVLQFFSSTLQFVAPQIVDLIIKFVSDSNEPKWKGFLYVCIICFSTLLNTILSSQSFYFSYVAGLKIRPSLTSAIYNKAIRLGTAGRKGMSLGETTNLMAIDSQRIMDFCLYGNMMWSSPLQIGLALYFLWQVLGPASLAGLAVMILLIPINIMVGKQMKSYTSDQMKCKDKRVKLMDEILNGMKVLKLYAWEPSFAETITNFRTEEISALKKSAILNAITTFMWSCAPFLIALASFSTFVLIDEKNVLDASTAFVSLTLFNLLRIPLNVLPMMILYSIQSKVSLDRINVFMNTEELDLGYVQRDESDPNAISVRNASFSWDGKGDTLNSLDISIPRGTLVGVVGQVGTGKSSLLSAIIGEMELSSGSVNVVGTTAYSPQQPWLRNATLRDNVTFSQKYKKKMYDRILQACDLGPDLEVLPAGDLTEIGEKGINLSGGQKARISLARCTYNNADVYFLDDPLSAVDPHVGKSLFENVISSETGILKNKTRVLVTHGITYLPKMDQIIVMKDGRVSECGTYRELLSNGEGEFSKFLLNYIMDEDVNAIEDEINLIKKDLETVVGGKVELAEQLNKVLSEKSTPGRKKSVSSIHSACTSVNEDEEQDPEKKSLHKTPTTNKLIEDEKMESGGIKLKVYISYIKRLGILTSIFSGILFLGYQGFSIGGNLWLSRWTMDPLALTDDAIRNKYLGVYGTLGFFQSIFVMLGSATLTIGTLNASLKIHGKMLVNVMRAPLSFFDTTPLGRILNRFSKDIDVADTTLPSNIRMLLTQVLNVLGTVVIICIALPLFVLIIIPIVLTYIIVQKIYISCARQVKRIESVSRSPIYIHFGETLVGISTIRAFRLTDRFIEENEKKIDFNQKCYFPTFVSSRWLSVRLETIGNLLILFVALFSVLSRESLEPGMAGLSLSYSLSITFVLTMLIRVYSDVETNMVSVERINEYENIPQEAPFDNPNYSPPSGWPQHGVIKFDNYKLRYREGLDLVLKGIDCTIQRGEKIGIVGRTGAGKSSLTLALFRIIEAAEGSIYIDNENIRFLGLGKLRSSLTIIPQDPVLFSGSLRFNLDPFGAYSDKEVWISLENAHLKSFVSNLPDGLFFGVSEGGGNLSIGQKQLICLARALLRKTQILILDEATAAVDLETDDLIQRTIREEFRECTVLTIAHRLNTIMDSNRIMVVDSGTIAEFAPPQILLDDTETIFYSMVNNDNTFAGSSESSKKK